MVGSIVFHGSLLIIGEVGAAVVEDGFVGESANVVLVSGVEKGNEVALDAEELALAEPFFAGVGRLRRGRS